MKYPTTSMNRDRRCEVCDVREKECRNLALHYGCITCIACKSFFYRSGKHMRLRGVSPGDMSLPEVYMQHLDNHKRFKQCLAAGMKPTLVLDPRKQRPANRAKQAAFRRRINEKLQRRGSVAHARRRAAAAAAKFEAPRDVDSASSSSSSSASTSDSASIRSVATTPTHSMAGSTDDSDANSAFTSATSVASSTSTATLASTAPIFDLQQTPAWWAIDEPQPMAASAAAAIAPKAHTPSAAAVAAAAAAGFHTRGHDPFAPFAAYTYTPRAVSTVARFDANSAAALSSSPAPGLTDAIVNTTATASCSTPSATSATAATASCSSDATPSADHWLSAIELETEAIDSEFSDIIETLARDYAGASATALEFLFPMA